ncbi:MAG: hypothetical protein BLM47_03775 [Candidatus Reconcilbacillus cellulovorans]|uniref:Uncharacterized protein n=1 Tax=Candidatus Reconcilbacillus cellulovorans TaxID=1906605 RepID=A0A2A6E1C2_9BACL|nr:MAG: hypothetical protein BLM47_03775 [Candidatus Reconcilbacillus cellulovorans]
MIDTLSNTIVKLAEAGRTAQQTLSSGANPMVIKEYGSKANLTCDMQFNSQTDISLKFWIVSLQQKFTFDYKQHWGLKVSCTIVPVVTLSDSAQ